MTAVGVALALIGYLVAKVFDTGTVFDDRRTRHDDWFHLVGLIAFFIGAVLVVAGVVVFLWRHMP